MDGSNKVTVCSLFDQTVTQLVTSLSDPPRWPVRVTLLQQSAAEGFGSVGKVLPAENLNWAFYHFMKRRTRNRKSCLVKASQ